MEEDWASYLHDEADGDGRGHDAVDDDDHVEEEAVVDDAFREAESGDDLRPLQNAAIYHLHVRK